MRFSDVINSITLASILTSVNKGRGSLFTLQQLSRTALIPFGVSLRSFFRSGRKNPLPTMNKIYNDITVTATHLPK